MYQVHHSLGFKFHEKIYLQDFPQPKFTSILPIPATASYFLELPLILPISPAHPDHDDSPNRIILYQETLHTSKIHSCIFHLVLSR